MTMQGSPIITHDLLPIHRSSFNVQAQIALDKPAATRQLGSRETIDENGDKFVNHYIAVKYFCVRVKNRQNIDKAAEKLINIINLHAELGHIERFLIPLSYIQLSELIPDGNIQLGEDYVIYSFPYFTYDGAAAVDNAKYDISCNEGTVPNVTDF